MSNQHWLRKVRRHSSTSQVRTEVASNFSGPKLVNLDTKVIPALEVAELGI